MKKLGFILVIMVFVLLGVFALANGRRDSSSPSDKIQVSTSFYPLYYFVSRIGGDLVDVQNITPAGAEPHDYEPTAQDIAHIERSKLLVLNGSVEAWGDKIRQNLNGTKVEIVTAGAGLLTKQLSEEGVISQDPHVWLDPQLAKQEVSKIVAGIEQVDPSHKAVYEANKEKLDSDLDALDQEYRQGLASCGQHDIITSHAAFAYLGARYGLHQVPIAGLSPDEEPSSQQLAEVANFARQNNVKYIFFESLVSPKLSQTIAQEIGAKTLVLDPLEGISDDDRQKGVDYMSVMKQNLKSLQIALQCQ